MQRLLALSNAERMQILEGEDSTCACCFGFSADFALSAKLVFRPFAAAVGGFQQSKQLCCVHRQLFQNISLSWVVLGMMISVILISSFAFVVRFITTPAGCGEMTR
jgi:hypothetical protein